MPSLSLIKALPFLLLTLPSSVISIPILDSPGQLTLPTPLGTYNISTAQVTSTDYYDTTNRLNPTREGRTNDLNITLHGLNPGNPLINCVTTWVVDARQHRTLGPSFGIGGGMRCTDERLEAWFSQLVPFETYFLTEFNVSIQYPGFAQAIWSIDLRDDNVWDCTDDKLTSCSLKSEINIPDVPAAPPAISARAVGTVDAAAGDQVVLSFEVFNAIFDLAEKGLLYSCYPQSSTAYDAAITAALQVKKSGGPEVIQIEAAKSAARESERTGSCDAKN
ncbi:MAG: hypothetical protein Q9168_008065 [Polycauliona sp. 1 TL-2023]